MLYLPAFVPGQLFKFFAAEIRENFKNFVHSIEFLLTNFFYAL
jgi:hypothetical protein